MIAHRWANENDRLGKFGIASVTEYRVEARHAVSNLLIPNGTVAASQHPRLTEVIARHAYEMRGEQ